MGLHIIRSGAWDFEASACWSGERMSDPYDFRSSSQGFRPIVASADLRRKDQELFQKIHWATSITCDANTRIARFASAPEVRVVEGDREEMDIVKHAIAKINVVLEPTSFGRLQLSQNKRSDSNLIEIYFADKDRLSGIVRNRVNRDYGIFDRFVWYWADSEFRRSNAIVCLANDTANNKKKMDHNCLLMLLIALGFQNNDNYYSTSVFSDHPNNIVSFSDDDVQLIRFCFNEILPGTSWQVFVSQYYKLLKQNANQP